MIILKNSHLLRTLSSLSDSLERGSSFVRLTFRSPSRFKLAARETGSAGDPELESALQNLSSSPLLKTQKNGFFHFFRNSRTQLPHPVSPTLKNSICPINRPITKGIVMKTLIFLSMVLSALSACGPINPNYLGQGPSYACDNHPLLGKWNDGQDNSMQTHTDDDISFYSNCMGFRPYCGQTFFFGGISSNNLMTVMVASTNPGSPNAANCLTVGNHTCAISHDDHQLVINCSGTGWALWDYVR